MKLHHDRRKVIALIIIPLCFLIIGYGLLYMLGKPFLRPLYSMYALISSEYGPGFEDTSKRLYAGQIPNKDILALQDVPIPNVGDEYGEIQIGRIGLTTKLYYGDSEEILYLGAGQYQGSFLPGFGRTILIAGHTVPYFQKLGQVNVNDIIQIATHYGTYQYKVSGTKVGKYNDGSLYDLRQDTKEQLILYTCYPLDGIGFKEERLFVYADKVSGPSVQGG